MNIDKNNFEVKGTKEYYIFEVTKILEEINSLLESKSDLKTIFKVNFKCSKAIDNFSIYSTKKMKDYRYEDGKVKEIVVSLTGNMLIESNSIKVIFNETDDIVVKYYLVIKSNMFEATLEKIKKCLIDCKVNYIDMTDENFNNDSVNNDNIKEASAIEIAKVLEDLKNKLDIDDTHKAQFFITPRHMNVLLNKKYLDVSKFERMCHEENDIKDCTITLNYIVGSESENKYNDWDTILVYFDYSDNHIEVHNWREFKNDLFEETLEKIKKMLADKNVKYKRRKRTRPVKETLEFNLGVLGKYTVTKDDECVDEDFETEKAYNDFVKKMIKSVIENINIINNKVIYNMYYALESTHYPLWEKEEFVKIIDEDKLPEGFNELTDKEKVNILYKKFDYNEENVIEKIKENVPFLNIDKFKNDLKITNVYIHKNLKTISIEFKGICNFFIGMIEFNYAKDYIVTDFHVL